MKEIGQCGMGWLAWEGVGYLGVAMAMRKRVVDDITMMRTKNREIGSGSTISQESDDAMGMLHAMSRV